MLSLIEMFCGPLIAVILFLIPAYLIYTRPSLAELRGVTVFLVVLGAGNAFCIALDNALV